MLSRLRCPWWCCTALLQATHLEGPTRRLAAEFLVCLSEARDRAPGMMKKLPQFASQLFQTLMTFLIDIEDDPQWHAADDEADEEAGTGELCEFGQECLDRIAISLGGASIVPTAAAMMPTWLADGDWRKRHAVLICLAQIAEGCSKVRNPPRTGLSIAGRAPIYDLPAVLESLSVKNSPRRSGGGPASAPMPPGTRRPPPAAANGGRRPEVGRLPYFRGVSSFLLAHAVLRTETRHTQCTQCTQCARGSCHRFPCPEPPAARSIYGCTGVRDPRCNCTLVLMPCFLL